MVYTSHHLQERSPFPRRLRNREKKIHAGLEITQSLDRHYQIVSDTNSSTVLYNTARTHLVILCFFMYLFAQLLQGRCPSHLVFLDRQRSHEAHRATLPSSVVAMMLLASEETTIISLSSWCFKLYPCCVTRQIRGYNSNACGVVACVQVL